MSIFQCGHVSLSKGYTVEHVLCGLCRVRPLVLNDRFHRYTSVEHDFCTTCYERSPVLTDRFCWAEGPFLLGRRTVFAGQKDRFCWAEGPFLLGRRTVFAGQKDRFCWAEGVISQDGSTVRSIV